MKQKLPAKTERARKEKVVERQITGKMWLTSSIPHIRVQGTDTRPFQRQDNVCFRPKADIKNFALADQLRPQFGVISSNFGHSGSLI